MSRRQQGVIWLLGVAAVVCTGPADADEAVPHPRLFVTAEPAPGLRSVAELKGDIGYGHAAKLWGRLKALADAELAAPPLVPSSPLPGRDPDYVRHGNRDFELCHAVGQRMLRAALASLIAGEEKYRDSALRQIEALFDTARWPDWRDLSHLGVAADLRTGQLSRDLAVAYDWLHPALTPDQRRMIVAGIDRHGIRPFWRAVDEKAQWVDRGNNWMTCIVGGLAIAGMASRRRPPRLAAARRVRGAADGKVSGDVRSGRGVQRVAGLRGRHGPRGALFRRAAQCERRPRSAAPRAAVSAGLPLADVPDAASRPLRGVRRHARRGAARDHARAGGGGRRAGRCAAMVLPAQHASGAECFRARVVRSAGRAGRPAGPAAAGAGLPRARRLRGQPHRLEPAADRLRGVWQGRPRAAPCRQRLGPAVRGRLRPPADPRPRHAVHVSARLLPRESGQLLQRLGPGPQRARRRRARAAGGGRRRGS